MKGNIDTRNTIPLSALRLSPSNVRRVSPKSIEAMAASIRSLGVIQNLAAITDTENPKGFEVIVGGRRLRALQLLAEQGHIPADHPVPVEIRDGSDTTEVSLAENFQREAMHPADEYDAFTKLTSEGKSVDHIADAFGVTPLVVERRLMLAKASPALIAKFREDELTTDQLIALCSTDDHALQESTWANAGSWNRDPNSLRRMVTREELSSEDHRVEFIGGLDVYEAAGGFVRRDLFSTDGQGGYLRDVALLDRLVGDKLESHAEQLRGEGWGWVEVHAGGYDWQAANRLGRMWPVVGELAPDLQAAVDALEDEAAKLGEEEKVLESGTAEYSEAESERLDEIWARQEVIEGEVSKLQEGAKHFPADAMKLAGAWVCYENGKARIERGLVKAEDRKELAKTAEVEGGRETQPAGRKDNAISDALRRSLLARRNHAVQQAVAANPRVAKVLLALQMTKLVKGGMSYGSEPVPSDLALRDGYGGARTHHPVVGDDASDLSEQLANGLDGVTGKLPNKDGQLWDALAEKSDQELDAIIAYGVAASVSLADTHRGLTAKLIDAVEFDAATSIAMTADSYFRRVSKPLILDALKEAGCDDGREALEKMKKGALATEAETRIAGTGWLPKMIRTPKPKADKPVKKAVATKKATKTKASKTAKAVTTAD